MTPREAADLIAEMVYVWTKECGRAGLVLTGEDREELAAVIETAQKRAEVPA